MTKFKEKARTISPFGGVISSEFRTNFILFDSPEGGELH